VFLVTQQIVLSELLKYYKIKIFEKIITEVTKFEKPMSAPSERTEPYSQLKQFCRSTHKNK
jgi:hypothetical protein